MPVIIEEALELDIISCPIARMSFWPADKPRRLILGSD